MEIEMRATDLSGFGPVGTNGPKTVDVLSVLDAAANVVDWRCGSARGAEAREANSAVADLVKASRRVTDAFRRLGRADGVINTLESHRECEAAMVALDTAVGVFGGAP